MKKPDPVLMVRAVVNALVDQLVHASCPDLKNTPQREANTLLLLRAVAEQIDLDADDIEMFENDVSRKNPLPPPTIKVKAGGPGQRQ